ncbi:MAG: NAD(P)-dependent oxidoreductase [Agarilytica sp.]
MGFKVILRGSNGDIERALKAVFDESALELVVAPNHDWSEASSLSTFLGSLKPCAIVNYGERPIDMTAEIAAVESLVEQCASLNIPFIHLSSFRAVDTSDHEATDDIDELSIANANDEIGRHFAALESICARVERHIILRLSWVLGGNLENIFDDIVPQLLNGDSVFVSDHDFGRPVTIGALANTLRALVQQILCGAENWGTFNIHSSDKCSEAEFCDALVRIMQTDLDHAVQMPLVAGVDDDRRLLEGNALLGGDRMTRNFGVQNTSWRKGLKATVKGYVDRHQALSDVGSG